MKYVLLVFILSINAIGHGQDKILSRIASLQVSEHEFYDEGLFPSQIVWKKGKKVMEDNNIFYSALIAYTLQSMRNSFSSQDQILIDSIVDRTISTYPYYKNRNGGLTYNFYQVRPENPFPGLKFFKNKEFGKLPDDLDCTAIIYMTLPKNDSINREVKQLMMAQSLGGNKIKSAPKEYKNSRAYRTWFADKMPQDLDIAVNCNILTYLFESQLTSNAIDSVSMDFIIRAVNQNKHLEAAYYFSAYYQTPPIVIYHLARLISVTNDEALHSLKPKLISDIETILKNTENEMEKVVLLTSLYRLGGKKNVTLSLSKLKQDMSSFYWFRTNFLCGRKYWIKRFFGSKHFLNYGNRCQAYYWILLLELQQISNTNIIYINDL